jgi:hypothetical protein
MMSRPAASSPRGEEVGVSTDTIVVTAVGGWVSACMLVLTCVALKPPTGAPSTSLEAVDRLLEHSRVAAAALVGIARAASADPADLVAEARCARGRCRALLAPVLAEFGSESDVGRSTMSLLASLQVAVDRLELALMRDDGRLATRPWVLVDPPLTAVRLAQDRLLFDVWRTLERRAGRAEAPARIAAAGRPRGELP